MTSSSTEDEDMTSPGILEETNDTSLEQLVRNFEFGGSSHDFSNPLVEKTDHTDNIGHPDTSPALDCA